MSNSGLVIVRVLSCLYTISINFENRILWNLKFVMIKKAFQNNEDLGVGYRVFSFLVILICDSLNLENIIRL